MVNEATMDKPREMQLDDMAQAFRAQESDPSLASLSFADRFGLLVDTEWSARRSRKLTRLIRGARLHFSGAGKTYMACAFGIAACKNFMRVKYVRLPDLLNDLTVARNIGTYKKLMSRYKRVELLILDEWLLHRLKEAEARDLLEIVEARHQKGSTIFLSQFAPAG